MSELKIGCSPITSEIFAGKLNKDKTMWKGEKINSDDVDYYEHPWEIEAYGMSKGLLVKFVVKEKLWEVFKGVQNPDSPIEIEPLGWKEMDI